MGFRSCVYPSKIIGKILCVRFNLLFYLFIYFRSRMHFPLPLLPHTVCVRFIIFIKLWIKEVKHQCKSNTAISQAFPLSISTWQYRQELADILPSFTFVSSFAGPNPSPPPSTSVQATFTSTANWEESPNRLPWCTRLLPSAPHREPARLSRSLIWSFLMLLRKTLQWLPTAPSVIASRAYSREHLRPQCVTLSTLLFA